MAESTVQLVNEVLRHAPMRQWAFSVPFPFRFLFAIRPAVMGKVLAIDHRTLATHLNKKAGDTKDIGAEASIRQARVMSLRAGLPEEDWPEVSDPVLLEILDRWLASYLISGITHLTRVDLHAALRGHLDGSLGVRINELAPTHLAMPSGARHALEQVPGQSPVLVVKLQEMFGLVDTPRIGGRGFRDRCARHGRTPGRLAHDRWLGRGIQLAGC